MKRSIRVVGVMLLLAVLAGAAYVGGQLLAGGGAAKGAQAQAGLPRKIVTPAAEMPNVPFDAGGDVTRIGDKNSIFICDVQATLQVNADGKVTIDNADCTPQIEVVIGHDTKMYRDISAKVNPVPKDGAGKDVVISQVVEPADGADIITGTAIRVWGDRRGDRISANLVVYWNRMPVPTGQSPTGNGK